MVAVALWAGVSGTILAASAAHLASNTDNANRGRIYALVNALIYLASGVGAGIAGAADALSTEMRVILPGGVVCFGAMAVAMRCRRLVDPTNAQHDGCKGMTNAPTFGNPSPSAHCRRS
jgi:hypothetical protein